MTARRYPGEDITLEVLNKNTDGDLIDAASVTLKTRMDNRAVTTSTPTKVSTGTYQQVIRPKYPGILWYRFEVTNSGVVDVEEHRLRIFEGGFEDQTATTDYV